MKICDPATLAQNHYLSSRAGTSRITATLRGETFSMMDHNKEFKSSRGVTCIRQKQHNEKLEKLFIID